MDFNCYCCHFWLFLFIVSLKKKYFKMVNYGMQSFWHAVEKLKSDQA